MPITLFYRFVITFADASFKDVGEVEQVDRLYQIVEAPSHRWTIAENAQPVVIADAQHAQLVQLLAALSPAPDPAGVGTRPSKPPDWKRNIDVAS